MTFPRSSHMPRQSLLFTHCEQQHGLFQHRPQMAMRPPRCAPEVSILLPSAKSTDPPLTGSGPPPVTASYRQFRCMAGCWSGGDLLLFLLLGGLIDNPQAILEVDSLDHVGQEFKASQRMPFLLRRQGPLEHPAQQGVPGDAVLGPGRPVAQGPSRVTGPHAIVVGAMTPAGGPVRIAVFMGMCFYADHDRSAG